MTGVPPTPDLPWSIAVGAVVDNGGLRDLLHDAAGVFDWQLRTSNSPDELHRDAVADRWLPDLVVVEAALRLADGESVIDTMRSHAPTAAGLVLVPFGDPHLADLPERTQQLMLPFTSTEFLNSVVGLLG